MFLLLTGMCILFKFHHCTNYSYKTKNAILSIKTEKASHIYFPAHSKIISVLDLLSCHNAIVSKALNIDLQYLSDSTHTRADPI